MPPSTLFCPKCGNPLTVPHPAPEEVACPKCRAAIRISSLAKVGAAPQPAPHRPTPALETKDVFQRKTELARTPASAGGYPTAPDQRLAVGDAGRAPAPMAASAPPNLRRIGVVLAAASACLLLVVGAMAVGVWALSGGAPKESPSKESPSKDKDNGPSAKDGKTTPTPGTPQVLIDEDFSKAVANRQTLPDGWSGDSFRVVKEQEEPCLEVSKPTGAYFVKLPPVTLSGDFSIEVACIVDYQSSVIVRLEARQTNALLPVALSYDGKVAIGDDFRLAPPNFKPNLPIQFLVKREGKKLRVFVNGGVVADKDLDAVTEFESVQLGMGTGNKRNMRAGGSKVFRLKVVTFP